MYLAKRHSSRASPISTFTCRRLRFAASARFSAAVSSTTGLAATLALTYRVPDDLRQHNQHILIEQRRIFFMSLRNARARRQ